MAAAVSSVPRLTFLNNTGAPLNGGNVYTYAAGTLTPKTFYSDEAKTVPVSNPIVINAAGRPQASAVDTTEVNLYYTGSAKFVVKDANGLTLYTADNIEEVAVASGGAGVTLISPTINTSILSASALLAGICGGRLTLTSGVPVTPTDVTAAATVYFTPYGTGVGTGNIGLYDGSATWTLLPFTEKSLALGTVTSGLPYDVFAYNNAGVVALEKAAWSSTSQIFSSGTYTTTRPMQNGIYVKSTNGTAIDSTRRYLGTFYTTSTTTTEDSASKRFLWNYYNRAQRAMRALDTTNTWTYSIAAFREANNSAANQLSVIVGVAEEGIEVTALGAASNSGAGANIFVSIGEDATNAKGANVISAGGMTGVGAGTQVTWSAYCCATPAIGYHFYAWLEYDNTGSGTTTWIGDAGGTSFQTGITGMWKS